MQTNQPIECAQIIIRKGSISDIPPKFSLAESLMRMDKPPKVEIYRIGTTKKEKWCKACNTNHPASEFVMDDGTVSRNYCKKERLRVLAKQEAKKMEAQKKKDSKLNKRRPMPVCELSKVF